MRGNIAGGDQVESDEQLVGRLRQGDQEALAPLFERHRDFVLRVALGLGGGREQALEVVQETFLALLRNPPVLGAARGRLTTWLYRVARNLAVDRWRRSRRSERPVDSPPPSDPGRPDAELMRRERGEALTDALRRLPPRPREVFALRVGLGLTVEETARLVGCRPGAVRTALHTAGRLLKARLAEDASGGRGGRTDDEEEGVPDERRVSPAHG
jgi:RNA polymerase sigma-70 factor (ECF subfamily)